MESKESKGERGGKSQDYEHFLETMKYLKPTGRTGFLARKDGRPISGLLFSSVCGHIIEGAVVRSKEDYLNKFYSQDLVRWKIIEWGVGNNMKYYNLAGFNPQPISSKEEGIMRYKKNGEENVMTILELAYCNMEYRKLNKGLK